MTTVMETLAVTAAIIDTVTTEVVWKTYHTQPHNYEDDYYSKGSDYYGAGDDYYCYDKNTVETRVTDTMNTVTGIIITMLVIMNMVTVEVRECVQKRHVLLRWRWLL